MAVSTGTKLRALAQNPRVLVLAGAAAVGVIYLRRHQAAADTTAADQGTALPVEPDLGAASGSFGDIPAGVGGGGDPGLGGSGLTGGDTGGTDTSGASGNDQLPVGPNAVAAGFWWGGKFWRPGQEKAFRTWLQHHGGNYDLWASRHPGAAGVFGDSPPPRPRSAKHVHPHRPHLPHPPSHHGVERRATLSGGTVVHTKAKPGKPRHRLPSGVRKAHPKIDSEATSHASRLVPRQSRPTLNRRRIRHGPASRLLRRPAGPSTRPRREEIRDAVHQQQRHRRRRRRHG